MDQQLRRFVALKEDKNLVPSVQNTCYNSPITSAPADLILTSGL